MAPVAVTPPAIEVKSLETKPKKPTLARANTANMSTKRKIICFSGTRMQLADREPHIPKRLLTVILF